MTTRPPTRRGSVGTLGSLAAMESLITPGTREKAKEKAVSPQEDRRLYSRNLALIDEITRLRELLRSRNKERAALLLKILDPPHSVPKADKSTQTMAERERELSPIRVVHSPLGSDMATPTLSATPPLKGSHTKLTTPPNLTSIRKSPLPKRGRGAAQRSKGDSLQSLGLSIRIVM